MDALMLGLDFSTNQVIEYHLNIIKQPERFPKCCAPFYSMNMWTPNKLTTRMYSSRMYTACFSGHLRVVSARGVCGGQSPWQTPPLADIPLGKHLLWQTPPADTLSGETSPRQTFPLTDIPLGRHSPLGRHPSCPLYAGIHPPVDRRNDTCL